MYASPCSSAVLSLLLCAWAVCPAAGQTYIVMDLGTFGGTQSVAYGLNDFSRVAGAAHDTNQHERPFVWADGVLQDLGTFSNGVQGAAWDINNAGEITGHADVSPTNFHAFLRDTNGILQDLGTLGGASSAGRRINELGRVAGWSMEGLYNPDPTDPQAMFWDGTNMMDLGTAGNYLSSQSYGINGEDQVVGFTFHWDPAPRWWSFIWEDLNTNGATDPGEMRVLGTLGGGYSTAYGINNSGQVVGWASDTGGHNRAFLITPTGGVWKNPSSDIDWHNDLMTNLGTLGGDSSEARAITGDGRIVGYSTTTSGVTHAFIWRGGEMTDLNDLVPSNSGWELNTAFDINEVGEIVGYGTVGGTQRGYLLTYPRRIISVHRVTHAASAVVTNGGGEVITQVWDEVEGIAVRWSPSWEATGTGVLFTLDKRSPTNVHDWMPAPPTSQWPISGTVWTTPAASAGLSGFFRVKAEPR